MPNFKTTSNASQFNNLENLIGSIHKHAHEYVQIFVQDRGLTEGQKTLLKFYQNVQIVSSTHMKLQRAHSIEVENELVLIDDKYDVRPSNDQLLYVDSIRKKLYLAIVIPFIRSQLSNLKNQLNLSNFYTPCRNPSEFVDLIFYHNEGEYSSLESELHQLKFMNKCYRKIRYLETKLTEKDNEYPRGSFIMWQKLFFGTDGSDVSLRNYGYTHFFLMEPDTRPIRRYWLDAIINQITDSRCQQMYRSTNWWISGSVYRGSKSIGQKFVHINGNALYHLSTDFITYVQNFSRTYGNSSLIDSGYDLALFLVLLRNHDLGKRLWHKFRFSDFIQNCWHTGCEGNDPLNNTQFILNNPHTYLIHGHFVKEVIVQQSNNFYKILAVCFLLIIVLLCQCRAFRWRSKRKRIINFLYLIFISSNKFLCR